MNFFYELQKIKAHIDVISEMATPGMGGQEGINSLVNKIKPHLINEMKNQSAQPEPQAPKGNFVDVQVFNKNMETIDKVLKTFKDKIDQGQGASTNTSSQQFIQMIQSVSKRLEVLESKISLLESVNIEHLKTMYDKVNALVEKSDKEDKKKERKKASRAKKVEKEAEKAATIAAQSPSIGQANIQVEEISEPNLPEYPQATEGDLIPMDDDIEELVFEDQKKPTPIF